MHQAFSVLFFDSSALRALSGSVDEPDSELQKDEEEGEDSLLCDSEEMDLLGEIFDTLSSRSSHERGLLYGTRSLDLFGPDSHDYIMKVRSGLTRYLCQINFPFELRYVCRYSSFLGDPCLSMCLHGKPKAQSRPSSES